MVGGRRTSTQATGFLDTRQRVTRVYRETDGATGVGDATRDGPDGSTRSRSRELKALRQSNF